MNPLFKRIENMEQLYNDSNESIEFMKRHDFVSITQKLEIYNQKLQ